MPLPPLYKYLDVRGAKLTLGNNTFRHAKPSDFNDVEDMTVQSLFPEPVEDALERLVAGFEDVIVQHIDEIPTCPQPIRDQVSQLQAMYRAHPELIGAFNLNAADIYDLQKARHDAEGYLAWVNNFMQGYRVLCVTTDISSERMWAEYADGHRGVALRIEPNLAKDSKFRLFEPVAYVESRPPIYDDTLTFISDSLFGDLKERARQIVHKVTFTKTLRWQHEREYRLAIALGENEEPYDTLLFHPEEVTELYLGAKMKVADLVDIIVKARVLNPQVKILQTEQDGNGGFLFRRLL